MKKGKNAVLFLCILITAFMMAACGKQGAVELPTVNEIEGEQPETAQEEEVKEAEEENEDKTEKEETTGELELSFVTKDVFHEEGEDAYVMLSTLTYDMLDTISLPGYEACEASMKAYFAEYEEQLLAADRDYAADAKKKFEAQTESDTWYGPSQTASIRIQRVDERVVSVSEEYYLYAGNGDYSDPTGYSTAANFDTGTGKLLTLADIASDEDAFKAAVEELAGTPLKDDGWALTNCGFLVFTHDMSWGNYGSEFPSYLIDYDELSQFFNEKYLPSLEEYTFYFEEGQEVLLDLDEDGTKEKIFLIASGTDDVESETFGNYLLSVNDEEVLIAEYAYSADAYVIKHKDGTAGFMVNTYFEGDYTALHPVAYMDGNLKEYDEMSGRIDRNTVKPDSLVAESSLDVLGTWGAIMFYNITEDYHLVSSTGEFLLENEKGYRWRREIVTAKELPVYHEDGSDSGEILPVGTVLYPIRTDAVTYMIAEKEDGTAVMIKLNKVKETEIYDGETYEYYYYQIDDEAADDYFEPLPYAG